MRSVMLVLILMSVFLGQSSFAAMSPKSERLVQRKPAFEPQMTIVEDVVIGSERSNDNCRDCGSVVESVNTAPSIAEGLQEVRNLEKFLVGSDHRDR